MKSYRLHLVIFAVVIFIATSGVAKAPPAKQPTVLMEEMS